MMILAISRRLPQLLELQRERTWQPLPGDGDAGRHHRHRRPWARSAEAVASLALRLRLPRHRHATGRLRLGAAAPAGDDEADRLVPPPHIDLVLPPEQPAGAAGRERLRGPGPAPDGRHRRPLRRADARPDQAGGLAHQRRAGRPHRRAGAACAPCARGRSAAPSWTPSATSRCPPTRRSTACPTASSRRTRHGPAAGCSTRSVELFCDNLRRYRAGEPLRNVVDPAAGY